MIQIRKDYFYDPESGSVYKNGIEILRIVGIKNIILLRLLQAERGHYITKEELIQNTWGKSSLIVTNSSLTQQIYLLRKSLSSIGINNFIISQSKVGYRIAREIEQQKYSKSRKFNIIWSIQIIYILIILALSFTVCIALLQ